jgi:hypothetical protein
MVMKVKKCLKKYSRCNSFLVRYELIKLTNRARSNFPFTRKLRIYLPSIVKQRVIQLGNNKIIFNIYLIDLSEQTSKVTATFEITKIGIISPKAGKEMYKIFIRERKKFLFLPAMN